MSSCITGQAGFDSFLPSCIPTGGFLSLRHDVGGISFSAGQAAAQLAISLRQGGHDGAIRMVGDEPYAPYQRPPCPRRY
jgi:hypothetical protein